MAVPENVKCFICGAENEFMVLLSSNSYGSMDLDTRPPEMSRSTMDCWVQVCPVCGYVAVRVSEPTIVDRLFLQSDSYKTCDGIVFVSELARAFYRQQLILLSEGRKEDAFFALLHASWACDDGNERKNATAVRRKAILLADDLLASGESEDCESLSMVRADLMRRSARFRDLLEQYGETHYSDDLLNRILDFEKALAKIRCRRCLTVADAEEYAEETKDLDEETKEKCLRARMYGIRYFRSMDAKYEKENSPYG